MSIATLAECVTYLRATQKGTESDLGLIQMFLPIVERLVRRHVGYHIEHKVHTEYHPYMSTRPSLSQGFTEDEDLFRYEGSPQGARPIRQGRGNSRDALLLRNLPVRSVTSIHEDPNAWVTVESPSYTKWSDGTLLVEARDYVVDWDCDDEDGNTICKSGIVFRNGGIWSLQARSIKVVYTAGYTDQEIRAGEGADFKQAVLMGVAKFVQEAFANALYGERRAGAIISESLDGYSVSFANPLQGSDVTFGNDLPVGVKRLLEPRLRMTQFI